MPFAGQMRLNTFLALAGGVGLLACSGVGAAVMLWPAAPAAPPDPPAIAVAPARSTSAEGSVAPVATPPVESPDAPADAAVAPADAPAGRPVDATAGRPVDELVLGYRGRDLGTDKLKDVTSGKPYKVNVYQDAGNATANRAKIDLDRDDKWDEKITFEPDKITRQVAPADDESYTETFRWDGAAWVAAP